MFLSSFIAVALIWQSSIVSCWKVTLWEHPNYKGEHYDYEDSGCQGSIEDAIDDNTSSVFTYGTCVRLYRDLNCTGQFFEMNPVFLSHQFSDLDKYFEFGDVASSIGPCSTVSGWKVTLWEDHSFNGPKYEYEGSGCQEHIEDAINDKASSVFPHGTCVRLYKDPSCLGNYVSIHQYSSEHYYSNISNAEFDDMISSLGPCTDSVWKVTLWINPDYKGGKYEFEGNGCHSLIGNAIDNRASSIDIHGRCVRLYADGHCKGNFIDIAPGISYLHLSDLQFALFNDVTSSIGPCRQIS